MSSDHDIAESTTITATSSTVAQPASLGNFRHQLLPSAVNQNSPATSSSSSSSSPTGNLMRHSCSSEDGLAASVLQRQFDEEDRRLAAERAELVAAAEKQPGGVFECGICVDTLPEESIARIEPCGHSFCRECVRELVVSRIESSRYPVLCPTCTAVGPLALAVAGSSAARPKLIGKVTRDLVLDIGTTQEQYEKWIELELAEFLVLLQCRRCGKSSYFDREGFNEARKLQCPVEGCAYAWCTRCQQEVVPKGPKHSCDSGKDGGSSAPSPGWAPAAEPWKPQLRRGWTFDFNWRSFKTKVGVEAAVEPSDGIRVQLAFLLKWPHV